MKRAIPLVLVAIVAYLLLRKRPPGAGPADTDAPSLDAARYTVRAGDSLWSIAKAGLPAGSSNATVLAYVRAIATANGMHLDLLDGKVTRTPGDPDTIYPGQVLTIPTFGA